MGTAYDGAGTPGDDTLAGGNGSNGCAKSGNMPVDGSSISSRYTCTFGGENSVNATNNSILIRFKLNATDNITRLSFRGASN